MDSVGGVVLICFAEKYDKNQSRAYLMWLNRHMLQYRCVTEAYVAPRY